MGKSALIIVDLQNDFFEESIINPAWPDNHFWIDGALSVPGANDHYKTMIENYVLYGPNFNYIIETRDWHPEDHRFFADENRPPFSQDEDGNTFWPKHCVQGSQGAEPVIAQFKDNTIRIFKGVNKDVDSYSAFIENDKITHTGLHQQLQYLGVTDLTVIGLALDYCVKFTVLDALSLGYNVTLIPELCRSIGDADAAIAEMVAAGTKTGKVWR
jgi:nicotinamidase/pyrazinamidase